MSRILLSNNTLAQYARSELVTYEIAQHLVESGHVVTVATFASGGDIRQDFDALGVQWIDLSAPPAPVETHFDLYWGHHSSCFDSLLIGRNLSADRIVFSSLSPYEPLECPPLYADSLTHVLANSHETREVIEGYGIPAGSITVMPNCITREWESHGLRRLPAAPRKLAFVSNHVPAEVMAAISRLQDAGVQVVIHGHGHDARRVSPALLADVDVVLTIGRTTQAALSQGIPVYCYDRFGGPGYITTDNFERAAFYNFSGRCCNRQLDAASIADELLASFPTAAAQVQELSARIRTGFFLPTWVDSVLDKVGALPALADPPRGSLAQARRIRIARSQVDRDTAIADWLESRTPSRPQLRLAQAHADASGALPEVAVFVLDRSGSRKHIRRTVSSLRSAARAGTFKLKIHVVSRVHRESPTEETRPGVTWHYQADGDLAGAVNAAATRQCGDWLLLVDTGEEFTALGLQAMVQEAVGTPDLRAVYADEVMRTPTGDLTALLRPDINLDLLLSVPGSMARHWMFRREVFVEAGGLDGTMAEAAEFDLLLRLLETGGIDGLAHVHEPLLVVPPQALVTSRAEIDALERHLRNRGYSEAVVESHRPGCYRIRYGHPAVPGVSIIVPTRNQFALLQRCIEGVLEKTAYTNYEILIVDNGSTDEDACRWLEGIEAMGSMQLRVLRHPGPFDYPAMVNMAAGHARGDYLLLLDNDTAILREDWLDALLNHAQRPEVGVVGAKLLRPSGTVEHAGYVLGVQGAAGTPFAGARLDAPGYMQRLQVDQNYSAVSGSCLMVRRPLFEEVGGLAGDAGLRHACNDVDLCLKVRAAGYLVVWTPHALVMHEGGASVALLDRATVAEKAARVLEAHASIYRQWLPVVAHDPAYNRHLSLNGGAFRVETNTWLNRDPLPWKPLPTVLALPADRFGCGYYRVIHPGQAMVSEGLADVRIGDHYISPAELERIAPDTIVFQRQMLKEQIEAQKRMTGFSRAFKVAELDDYMANIPLKSVHRDHLPQDLIKHMRAALKSVDRLVVSTEPLAEAMKGLHPEIRVSRNRLPAHWWAHLKGRRRQGRLPRVGWGGGASHRGDLELVADVVRALSDEVEWVFMGMCPEKLRPFIHEFHQGVPITEYPARLAALDLDLAIAPLEDNQFNRCKSNLRLLEFGACGFPVVCSDVAAFQDGLPVTRVKPRFKDWVDAIRMHVNDLDAAARAGDALREAIHRDWMLDEASAREWLASWMPD
ncbi:glycosyltransferase [Pseudoxanthomonas suwonensis]|uniref:glycosyltransferase n=1 Tax=Pseudoxanthomonas suwonensis TaxID=314722 RepID=UPI00138F0265|nr:glycosyltransferase [Pseudoxanthomonas suwonensis]KAF1699817.1 O-antigen biosynthesis protein [Pseudoxanthomonas suwonensis]